MIRIFGMVVILAMLLALAPAPVAAAPLPQVNACAVAVNAALGVRGYPYVWGSKGPSAFDCSGLTYWAYQQSGVNIGVSTYDQQATGVSIPCTLSDLNGISSTCWQPGDLIFLSYTGGQHVALYAGSGLFMDAYDQATGVVLHDVSGDSFYRNHFWQARRPIECASVSINPGVPSAIPGGSSPAIEAIANIISPITLTLPWACGACGSGQADIAPLRYPDFGPDALYPFKWFGVWLWNEVFRALICWLLAISQALLNAAAYAINAVVVAGINLVWRLAVLALLWIRDMFLSIWAFLSWLRLLLWDWYGSTLGIGQSLLTIGPMLSSIIQIAGIVVTAIADLLTGTGQALIYLMGLFISLVPGMVMAVLSPIPPEQLAQIQSFFLFQMFVGIFQAIVDSKLGWAWFVFVAVIYLQFTLWLFDELSTLNQ